nr:MAG TPA: hypothetical protein [Bacteriophage sp.]
MSVVIDLIGPLVEIIFLEVYKAPSNFLSL